MGSVVRGRRTITLKQKLKAVRIIATGTQFQGDTPPAITLKAMPQQFEAVSYSWTRLRDNKVLSTAQQITVKNGEVDVVETYRVEVKDRLDDVYIDTLSITKVTDGKPGDVGKRGQVIVQREWKEGDIYRNNDDVIDYVYHRATDSWWRLREGYDNIKAGLNPSNQFVQLTSLEHLAVNNFVAENANIAGFIFKDKVLKSQLPNLTNPNLILDGVNGKIIANDAKIKGHIEATSGKFTGEINATSGNIKDVTATNLTVTNLNATNGSIKNITGDNITINSGTFKGKVIFEDGTSAQDAIDKKVKEGVDSLEIGGRNLWLNTTDVLLSTAIIYSGDRGFSKLIDNVSPKEIHFVRNTNEDYVRFLEVKLEVHTEYVVSMYLESDKDSGVRLAHYDGSAYGHMNFTVKKGLNKIVSKFKSRSVFWDILHLYFDNKNINVKLSQFKLEKGNVATDWSPATEDIDKEITNATSDLRNEVTGAIKDGIISESEAQVIGSKLSALATQKSSVDAQYNEVYASVYLKGTTKIDLANKKTTYNTAYGTLVAKINAVVAAKVVTVSDKAVLDNLFNTHDASLSGVMKSLDASRQSIEDEKINSLEFGGLNYYSSKTNVSTINVWFNRSEPLAPNGFKITGQNNTNPSNVRLSNVIKSNGWWTISFDVMNSQNVSASFMIDFNDAGMKTFRTTNDSKFTRIVYSFNVTNHSDSVYNFIDFSAFQWYYYYFKNIKVEKGNVATDWSPAPEDTQAELDALNLLTSQQRQELDTVKRTTDKLNQVTNYLTTTVDGGVVTTSTLQVGATTTNASGQTVSKAKAGITGVASGNVTNINLDRRVVFWASTGFTQRENALFQVWDDGKLVAQNADIKGKITATSGEFTGKVTATSGSFTGTVNANAGTFNNVTANNLTVNSGTFTGRVVANTGKIGNFTITAEGIENHTMGNSWDYYGISLQTTDRSSTSKVGIGIPLYTNEGFALSANAYFSNTSNGGNKAAIYANARGSDVNNHALMIGGGDIAGMALYKVLKTNQGSYDITKESVYINRVSSRNTYSVGLPNQPQDRWDGRTVTIMMAGNGYWDVYPGTANLYHHEGHYCGAGQKLHFGAYATRMTMIYSATDNWWYITSINEY